MKFFSETVNTNPEDLNSEKVNKYDQPVSEKDISGLREDIVEKIEKKAGELNISKDKLIELARLDLESLNPENLENLNRGSLEFIKDSIDKALNEFWKSEKTGKLVTGTTSKLEGSINEAFEFAKKHKKVVSLGELALYASSYGAPALNILVDDDVKVEIKGHKISLKDLEKNPELMAEIDRINSQNSPIDILEKYPSQSFDHFNNNQDNPDSFSILVETEIDENNSAEKTVSFSFNNILTEEKLNKLKNDLESMGINFNAPRTTAEGEKIETISSSLEYFIENKEQVAKIIADSFNIPENEVKKYIDNQITPDTSKVSVVELNDFKIGGADNYEINQTLNQKWHEILDNNFDDNSNTTKIDNKILSEFIEWFKQSGHENVNGVDVDNISDVNELIFKKNENGTFSMDQSLEQKYREIMHNNLQFKTLPEISTESLSEFIEWFKQSGHENVNGVDVDNISNTYEMYKIIFEKKEGTSSEEFKNLQELEKNNFNEHENNDEFKKLFLELLEKNGYSLEKLKEVAEDNPEEVIKIISEVIGKGVEYDEEKDEKRKEKNMSFQDPNLTLEGGYICGDYSKTLAFAKHVLEKEGVPNFDKFIVLTTHSVEMDHEWNMLVTVDSDENLIISFIDSTWHDSGGELNAVDEEHYYKRMEKLAIESIQKALKSFALQEELKKILTQYDPRHKPEIEVDKKAFEEMAKKKKRSSREDKKKDVNSLP